MLLCVSCSGAEDTHTRRYLYAFYWSTLMLTAIGEVPAPVSNVEHVLVAFNLMIGVLLFATIVGNVGRFVRALLFVVGAQLDSISAPN
jgi:hypothetical protein